MKIKLFIILISAFLTLPLFCLAASDCLTIDQNLGCSKLGTDYFPITNYQGECGTTLLSETLCCCKQNQLSSVKPKYIIIGALSLIFGIITVLSFLVKKNED